MMRMIKYAETAIFLAVISASACAIGEECGWRRVCEVPETQIEWEETPSHVRSLSRLVGALDIGLSNGLPASDFGRIKELARALDHDPDKCYRYVRDNIAYASYAGLLKGPERTSLDREGNELDQSFLLLALLRASGFTEAGIGYAPLATSNGVLTSCFLLPLRAQESASEYNAADWLGVDASGYASAVASRVIRLHNLAGHYNKCFYVGVGGAPYLAMDHFFVTLPTPGGTDLMDPSVKPSKKSRHTMRYQIPVIRAQHCSPPQAARLRTVMSRTFRRAPLPHILTGFKQRCGAHGRTKTPLPADSSGNRMPLPRRKMTISITTARISDRRGAYLSSLTSSRITTGPRQL